MEETLEVTEIQTEEANRYDAVEIETKFDTTPEGFLTGTAIVTRVGVFPYLMPSGSMRWELRHPDDVFHADSLSTIIMKPLTNDHPKAGTVTAENANEFVVGSMGNTPIHNDSHLAMPLVVHNGKAIKDVKRGKRQLSCGYRCDVMPEVGTFNGISYTHRQINIRYNHTAIVQSGRAGAVAQIRLDGALAPVDIENEKENTMEKEYQTIVLDSVELQAEQAVIDALGKTQEAVTELQTKLDAAVTVQSTLEATKDSLQEKLDAVEKELADLKANHVDASDVAIMVKQRVELEAFAAKVGVEVKADMLDVEIKKAVVLKEAPNAVVEKLDNADYLQARYDTVVEDFDGKQERKADQAVRGIQDTKVDEAPKKSYKQLQAEYAQRLQNAYKTK